LQEGNRAYDPFGALINNVPPPTSDPPPNIPFYGATYGGASWNSFTDANNLTTGCFLDGVRTQCKKLADASAHGGIGSMIVSTTGLGADLFDVGFGGVSSSTRVGMVKTNKDGSKVLGPGTVDDYRESSQPGRWITSLNADVLYEKVTYLLPGSEPLFYPDSGPDPQNSTGLAKAGGAPAGNTLFSQKQIMAAVDNCSRTYFNIGLDNLDPSRRGHNGVFNGTDYDARPDNSNVTVVNDVSAFTGKQLDAIFVSGGNPGGGFQNGLTMWSNATHPNNFSPYRNFTARDINPSDSTLAGVSAWQDTQIWELGNSLSRIKLKNNLPPKIEPGKTFEDCVRKMLAAHVGG
jgi:hypothetical protein